MRGSTHLVCALALVVAGCGSKKKKPAETTPESAGSSQAVAETPGSAAPVVVGSPNDMNWDEPVPDHSIAPLTGDPDAAMIRYETECAAGATSDTCNALRSQTEHVLLDSILGLRDAEQEIDREWYRVAARATTPELACLGVYQLAYVIKDRTPEDDAALLAAIENPAPSVRSIALGAQAQAITTLVPRAAVDRRSFSGMCIDANVDPEYGAKWAGGYPTAKFRFFASSAERRWFTTADPVDKVLAFFASAGKPGMTKSELNTAAQQQMIAEVTRLSQTTKPGDEQKMAAEMQALGAKYEVREFKGVENADQIRYVKIAPNIQLAVFKDDILGGASLVAMRPAQPGLP